MLIDVAISGDRNTIKKRAEAILDYKEFTTEIQRMWNVKSNVIPIIITTATRIISISFKNVPKQHTAKARNRETTDNSHIGHCAILRKALMLMYKNIGHEKCNVTCTINCNCRIVATL